MSDTQKPLIIKDWQNAMGDSEHGGFALALKADIESFPGAVKVKNRMFPEAIITVTQTFTVNTGTDIGTAAGDLRSQAMIDTADSFTGAAVTFSTTTTLPAPLVAGTVYFLNYQSNTTFKIYDTVAHAITGGATGLIDITTTGTGTHTITAVPMGQINSLVKDPIVGYYYAFDSNGLVWTTGHDGGKIMRLLTGNTSTNSNGQGLVLFKTSDGLHTYLFVFRNALIDVIEVTATANINVPSWNTAWKTLNSGAGSNNPHYAIVGQDNLIYFVDDRYTGSIKENSGQVFDPANAATFTYNRQALSLPLNEVGQWLEELGTNLLTAGGTFNKIYPWDRLSSSFTLPLQCPEKKIYRLKALNNLVYIAAGTKGNIYYTQGSYVKFFKKIPFYAINNGYTILSGPVTWGGMTAGTGSLLVGVGTSGGGYNGVYRIYEDGRMLIDQQPYGGNTNPTAIYADDDLYVVGYNGGVDYNDSVAQYSNFETVIHSDLRRVGNKISKATYSRLEMQLSKPLASGNSHARISYRYDSSSNFIVLATYTLDASTTSYSTDIGLTDVENIEIQVEMDGNLELMQVALWP